MTYALELRARTEAVLARAQTGRYQLQRSLREVRDRASRRLGWHDARLLRRVEAQVSRGDIQGAVAEVGFVSSERTRRLLRDALDVTILDLAVRWAENGDFAQGEKTVAWGSSRDRRLEMRQCLDSVLLERAVEHARKGRIQVAVASLGPASSDEARRVMHTALDESVLGEAVREGPGMLRWASSDAVRERMAAFLGDLAPSGDMSSQEVRLGQTAFAVDTSPTAAPLPLLTEASSQGSLRYGRLIEAAPLSARRLLMLVSPMVVVTADSMLEQRQRDSQTVLDATARSQVAEFLARQLPEHLSVETAATLVGAIDYIRGELAAELDPAGAEQTGPGGGTGGLVG